MKSAHERCGVPVGILSLAVLLIAVASVNAQSGHPCGCKDVSDLINQLNIANATLFKLDQFEQRTRQTIAPSVLTHGAVLNAELAALLTSIDNKKANAARAETDSVFCEINIDAPTQCLKYVLQARESISEKFCDAAKANERFEKNDRKNRWPMQTYIDEQREAYKAEIAEILKILRSLPANCPRTEWYGTIYVVEEIHNRTVIGKESSDDHTTRTGTITFNGDNIPIKRSFWDVNARWVNEKSGGGMRACTGGLRPGVPDTPYTTSFMQEINKAGATSETTILTMGEPDDESKVQFSFKMAKVITKVTGQTKSTRSSGCPNDDINETVTMPAYDSSFDAEPVNVTTKLTRKTKTDPEKIEGSETITVMSVTTDRATLSHTIKVIFRLYRM
jgi:hypothetical protein